MTHASSTVARIMVLSALFAGCGGANEAVSTADQEIYSGQKDSDESASASVVSVTIGDRVHYELCTGTLIAPNVVLTARHCVTHSIASTIVCDESGESGNGKHLGDDEDPTNLHVYVGPSPKLTQVPVANGRAIFHPGGSVICNADIALVVLDAPITNIAPMAVRLGGSTDPTESVRSVGFGKNDGHMPVGTRLRKDNVKVLAVGRGTSDSMTILGSHEFEVGLSICEGDSGGPAISESTGAVIGVVSRSGYACTDDFGHIYTSTSGFQSMFDRAFAMAGGAPIPEKGRAPSTYGADDVRTTPDSNKHTESESTNLGSGAPGPNAQACGARIASTSELSGWGLGASLGALVLLAVRRRRR